MSFSGLLEKYPKEYISGYLNSVNEEQVKTSLNKAEHEIKDFLNLLSPKADGFLEQMAVKSQEITVQYFGRVIILYIPLYISNYCNNSCTYCGFRSENKIPRSILSLNEVEENVVEIARKGIKHILLLTGENRSKTSLGYLLEAVRIVKKYFSFIGIEMFPMEMEEYARLKEAGVDGLTIYQEVYDREIYKKVHLSGKKTDYLYRLDTPERGAKANLQSVNIGPLLGLGEPLSETFYAGLHAYYLQKHYPEVEISLSVPRINEAEGACGELFKVDDRTFVRIITALRIFLKRAGITLSTRESPDMRDNLVSLGITRMSAGSQTGVGSYTAQEKQPEQFSIRDERSIEEITKMIGSRGYEPIFKDWEMLR
ncbi:MAG: 2-iminoacetate synthase ThiH [Elusimicrobia bacterium]|nr:2-iminoacetate synthase ThiH [Elusimicrobiota bacterium]